MLNIFLPQLSSESTRILIQMSAIQYLEMTTLRKKKRCFLLECNSTYFYLLSDFFWGTIEMFNIFLQIYLACKDMHCWIGSRV